jgi:glucosyl-3-phosphoglycerate synthase
MSDFYQSGVVATLLRLGQANGHKIESELEVLGKQRPIALVLPALYSEFESGRSAGNHSGTPRSELPA